MRRLICERLPSGGARARLSETEAHHATRVLRLRPGDRVEALDGKGGIAIARLEAGADGYFLVEDGSAERKPGPPASGVLPLQLEIAILKGDAMSWVIEKCVELGVERLVPLVTERTVVRIDKKGPEAFLKRWQAIADQALKQCGRLHRLEIAEPAELALHLRDSTEGAARFWCDEDADESGLTLLEAARRATGAGSGRLALMIGPEGGWAPHEREMLERSGATRVTLGPLVMRAETAALFGTGVLNAWLHSLERPANP